MDYNLLTNKSNVPKAPFIAEAGINHDGDINTAKQMVDIAVAAQADYVKFQSFKADQLVTPDALTSSYIKAGSQKDESFSDLLKRLELNIDNHYELKEYCEQKYIKFLSTAFDNRSFDLLMKIGSDIIKVASGDLTNIPFLRYMAQAHLPMIVSTGMATLGEIEEAVKAISIDENNDQIVLLHCISWYPAKIETTNLNYINTLKNAFGFPVGFSDHTLGVNMTVAARALGAVMFEKHFTTNSKLFGPDHSASLNPDELKILVQGIREVESGLGSSVRKFSEKEIGQRKVHRRSIITKKSIKQGEVFSEENLIIKRPGIGIKPKHWYNILGKKANLSLKPEQLLKWIDVDF
jgi:N-acetylneuraminate synthase